MRRRIWVPPSSFTFPLLELTTEAGPEELSESPFIPITPWLLESSERSGVRDCPPDGIEAPEVPIGPPEIEELEPLSAGGPMA